MRVKMGNEEKRKQAEDTVLEKTGKIWDRKKKMVCLLLVEAVLLLFGVLGLFGKKQVYEYGLEDMHANFGTFEETLQGYQVTQEDGVQGNLVDFGPISLPMGGYQVSLQYRTNTDLKNICTVSSGVEGYRAIKTNGEHLYSGLTQTDFEMWLTQDVEGMLVHAEYGGEGELTVTGLVIRKTNVFSRIYLFWVVVIFGFLYMILVFKEKDKKGEISIKDKKVIFALGVILLFSSMPLMVDYMPSGGDLGYHLMRIEGIKDSILHGMFPARNAPNWQQGYGYASAIFYGETLLYLAAFFRLIGFTVLNSYRLFFFCMTVAQVLIAYFCFRKLFQEKYVGVFCAMLYTPSIYRIYKTYACGSFGESFGVLFLPFLAYGFYLVFAKDHREKDYKWSWIPLTIGFTGLIQSHLLTCEMVGFFTILLCLLEIRKVFRLNTFVVLAKTVIYSALLSAWFLVPFFDYMLHGNFVIQNVSERRIQERGLYLSHLFYVFSKSGNGSDFVSNGMYETDPISLGLPLAAAFLLWLGLSFFGKTRTQKKEEYHLGWICCSFAGIAMLMSLSIFPWDQIHGIHPIVKTLVSSIQFPNRLLTIANISLVTLAGVLAKWVLEQREENRLLAYFGGMLVCLMASNLFLLTDFAENAISIRVYNGAGMGTGYISGAEYLPYEADASKFSHRDPIVQEGVTYTRYEKNGLTIDLVCQNSTKEERTVHMPLLYYKGYVSFDRNTGNKLETFADSDFFVTVKLPAGYAGELRTCFQSPWYWRVAELMSLCFLVTILFVCRKRNDRLR